MKISPPVFEIMHTFTWPEFEMTCTNSKLSKNEYDTNFSTSKVVIV